MSTINQPYKIERGKLHGPNGAWSLEKISAIYKRECGKVGLKKWLVLMGALTAAGLAASGPMAPPLAIAGLGFGYYLHSTMRVFAVIDGKEVELLCEVFYVGWRLKEANEKCDALIKLVTNSQR